MGGGGNSFTNICLAFRQIGGGQRVFLVSAFSQLSLAPNNPYAKEAYLGWHILLPINSLTFNFI